MDIRQIEFVLAVAEDLNFTRAAERSHVTQSGLSASVRALERELGVDLFIRSSRSVELTAAGRAFVPRARRMFRDAQALLHEVVPSGDGAVELRVGAEQCLGDLVDLPDLLAVFQERHPQVTVSFQHGGSAELTARLANNELDVALVARASGDPAPVGASPIAEEPFELLTSARHRPDSSPVRLTDLDGLRFVDLGPTWTGRIVLDRAFAEADLVRISAYRVDDVHLLLDLVRRGLAIAVVPEAIARKPYADGLQRVPITDSPRWAIDVATRRHAPAVVRTFAGMLFDLDTLTATRSAIAAA